MTSNQMRGVAGSAAVTLLFVALASTAHAAPDFSGVWGMVQHDRRGDGSGVTERWHLDDPAKFKIMGLRPDRPPPKVEGKILVNEMTMNDPQWYADKDYKVTVIYRKNMFYDDFAPLDGPPPLAATLGPEGVAEFLRKGAGFINQVEQSVLKRLPDVSY